MIRRGHLVIRRFMRPLDLMKRARQARDASVRTTNSKITLDISRQRSRSWHRWNNLNSVPFVQN